MEKSDFVFITHTTPLGKRRVEFLLEKGVFEQWQDLLVESFEERFNEKLNNQSKAALTKTALNTIYPEGGSIIKSGFEWWKLSSEDLLFWLEIHFELLEKGL